MKYGHVWIDALDQLAGEDVAAAEPLIFGRIGEALPLDAGHVDDICFGQGLLEIGRLLDHNPAGAQIVSDLARHPQRVGGDKDQLAVIVPVKLDAGVHRAAILQVAAEHDGVAVDPSPLRPDGVQIQQRLGGVLSGAISAIDHHRLGYRRRPPGGSDLRVAHGDDVHVLVNGADRILQ